MKRYVRLILACMVLAAGAAGCSRQPEGVSSYTVELDGNITTGYEWTCTFSQPGIVKQVISDYKGNQNPEGALGAEGTFIFEFEGVQPGDVELLFTYRRPWEEGAAPAKAVSYRLKVDKKLLIHAEKLQDQPE